MTTAHLANEQKAAQVKTGPAIDMKLEVVAIPVSDVDRAKRFYGSLGWRLDAEFASGDAFRVLQFTPTRSSCSIHFGKGVTSAVPGSAQGLLLVVSDVGEARADLVARGVRVSEVFHRTPGEAPVSGRDPEGRSYASYATFQDPDGNTWVLQEVTQRLPGRVEPADATFASAPALARALRRAAAAHEQHEQRIGTKDNEGWPEWYAEYLVREQAGEPLPA